MWQPQSRDHRPTPWAQDQALSWTRASYSGGFRSSHEARFVTSRPRRGGGILLMAVVSAMTGLNLMLGGGLGFVVGSLTDAGDTTPALVVLGAGLGAATGVFFGVRVALGFGGSSGISSAPRMPPSAVDSALGLARNASTFSASIEPPDVSRS